MALGKREQNKQRTREALGAAAWALMLEQGFDGTSVVAIADRAGVVERTFYRYFDSKEAVLFDGWREQLIAFEAFITGRPVSEPILMSLRAFSRHWAEANQSGLERGRLRRILSAGSTRVRDYERTHVFSAMRTSVLEVVGLRLGVRPDEDYRVPLIASVFIELLMATKQRWLSTGGSLSAQVEAAWAGFDALRSVE